MFGFSRKFNHYFCLSALLDIYNFETKLLKNKQCYLLFCICFFIPENSLSFFVQSAKFLHGVKDFFVLSIMCSGYVVWHNEFHTIYPMVFGHCNQLLHHFLESYFIC